MEITLGSRNKQDDIQNLESNSAERVNRNFDAITQDLRRIRAALTAYQIDLGTDIDTTTDLPLAQLAGVDGTTTDQFLRKDGTFSTISLSSLAGVPLPGSRRHGWHTIDAAAQRFVGMPATPAAPTSFVQDVAGFWGRYTTGAVATNSQTVDTSTEFARGDNDPYMRFYIRTGSSIASIRLWFGMFSGGAPDQYNDPTLTTARAIAFRYSTGVPDPGWVGVATNAAGTTVQTTASVAAIAASTTYLLEITVSSTGGSVSFKVNQSTAVVLDTSASPITTNMRIWATVTTLAAGAKVMDLKTLYFDAL